MSDLRDVSGVWYGRYDGVTLPETNSFIAQLAESGGQVSGSVSEPDRRAGATRRATVSGDRSGSRLRFTKIYDGTGGWNHAVLYAGRISADGTEVSGTWSIDWARGTFTMQRETFTDEAFEDDAETVAAGGALLDEPQPRR